MYQILCIQKRFIFAISLLSGKDSEQLENSDHTFCISAWTSSRNILEEHCILFSTTRSNYRLKVRPGKHCTTII